MIFVVWQIYYFLCGSEEQLALAKSLLQKKRGEPYGTCCDHDHSGKWVGFTNPYRVEKKQKKSQFVNCNLSFHKE